MVAVTDIYDARGKLCEEPNDMMALAEQVVDDDIRIADACDYAWSYSAHPGEGAARYTIDQMLRVLLGPDGYDRFVAGWEAVGSQRWDVGMLP